MQFELQQKILDINTRCGENCCAHLANEASQSQVKFLVQAIEESFPEEKQDIYIFSR